jgi:L-lactate dehydrogenase complex protein LldG
MSDREPVLARIRRGLREAPGRRLEDPGEEEGRVQHEHTPPGAWNGAALVGMFRKEAEAQAVRVWEALDPGEAVRTLGVVLRELAAGTVFTWNDPLLDRAGLPGALARWGVRDLTPAAGADGRPPGKEALKESAALADAGVTTADFALADSGTLVLLSAPGKSRVASLLPPVHIALLPASRILPDLPSFMGRLPEDAAASLDRESAVTFVTGTSKTADVELTLVRGVHGPGEVHVILING